MKRTILVTILMSLCAYFFAQDITVGTYNVRYYNNHDSIDGNGWDQRHKVIISIINNNEFDILGTQEVRHNQLLDLNKGLPDYDYVGIGRDDGKTAGEYAAIFYKKTKFDLVDSGHFWLAEDTSKPNKGWDASHIRICTWARLWDKKKRKTIYFFNLHMDHKGKIAIQKSTDLVLDKIKSIAKKDAVVLTGDFNFDQIHRCYAKINNSGILTDSYNVAKKRHAPNGTVNHFRPDVKTNERIDHLFVSQNIDILKYSVITDTYLANKTDGKIIEISDNSSIISIDANIKVPSDHYPVKIDFNYK